MVMMVKVNCDDGEDGLEDYDGVGDAAHDDRGHGDDDDENADSNANCKLHWTLSSAVDRHAIAKS